jgi:riboflavin kinase/FMN adenylyltransferase
MATWTSDWRTTAPGACRDGAVSIGNFDGVHRGHAALVAELAVQARAVSGPAVALTFEPHPLALLRPGQPLPVLTSAAERSRLLHALGADHVLVLNIDRDLLSLSAAAFFERVLRAQLGARAVVEGPNFGFGHRREGDIDTLRRLCAAAGLTLAVVPPVLHDGQELSSSRVRAALLAGGVEAAAEMLGRPYRLQGTVIEGRRRGRTLGFPTANLGHLESLAPGDGVYAARAAAADGGTWPAAVNVGPNPTFAEDGRKIEAHLIGFNGDLYGQPLALDFLRRLRDTRPFSGPAELVEQLRRDVEQARECAA